MGIEGRRGGVEMGWGLREGFPEKKKVWGMGEIGFIDSLPPLLPRTPSIYLWILCHVMVISDQALQEKRFRIRKGI